MRGSSVNRVSLWMELWTCLLFHVIIQEMRRRRFLKVNSPDEKASYRCLWWKHWSYLPSRFRWLLKNRRLNCDVSKPTKCSESGGGGGECHTQRPGGRRRWLKWPWCKEEVWPAGPLLLSLLALWGLILCGLFSDFSGGAVRTFGVLCERS